MIEADLKRKTNSPEDILTSNCLGLLGLMDDCYLIDFCSTAIDMGGKNLNLSEYNSVKSIDFWPRLQGKEPDIITVLEGSATGQQIVLIIEVKHGSGKSGTSGEREGAETTDQLAKYWFSAKKTYPDNNLAIVYLTHHRSFPKQEITESIKEAGSNTSIYWTSWFKFQIYVSDRCKANQNTRTELNILRKLNTYIKHKGYSRFERFVQPVQAISIFYINKKNTKSNEPTMTSEEHVEALKSFDSYYKNLFLLFNDIVAEIKEVVKAISQEKETQLFKIEHQQSEFYKEYVFEFRNRVYFIGMLVKKSETRNQNEPFVYETICEELEINKLFPLILVYGVFCPRDTERFDSCIFNKSDARWFSSSWAWSTIGIGLSDVIANNLRRSEPYKLNTLLDFQTNEDQDSWWCEQAIFKIKKITDIQVADDISKLVKDILSINPK